MAIPVGYTCACKQRTACGSIGWRQSGHSSLSATHSCTHAQQKMCPHGVTDGALRGARHSAQLRVRTLGQLLAQVRG